MNGWRDRILFTGFMGAAVGTGLGVWGIPQGAIAQIIQDDTLGVEQSQILDAGGGLFGIFGGAQRDINLFHSFQEFNVENGGGVFFLNPAGVENILARVTGDNPSNILGVLGVLDGDANLFLMNPNGIVFGPNAQLNLQGSFVATTADGIGFGGQEVFSAFTPEVPSPLLTVNPEAFFFSQLNPGGIINNSVAFAGVDPSGAPLFGLRVDDGQDLLFLGGDIQFDRGRIAALGGRVELAAVNDVGQVRLTDEGRLRLPRGIQRGNVEFANGAFINVPTNDSGGEINISARTITLTGGSVLLAGVIPGQDSPDNQAGNITLNASEQVLLQEGSGIGNLVFPGATGVAVNIEIYSATLEVRDGSVLLASTRGEGNAGNIFIRARDRVSFSGTSEDGQFRSGAFSSVDPGGIGDGGNIDIRTTTLEVRDGAQLSSSTLGTGNAGNVVIRASDRVSFSGTSEDGLFSSGAFSSVDPGGIGDGGNIDIRTTTLEVRDGAQISASANGRGNAGTVMIRASDRVSFSGTSEDGLFSSGAFSSIDPGGIGDGGNIDIRTATLEVRDGAQLSASTLGAGNAGNVVIEARDRIDIDGVTANGASSGIFTITTPGATGRGGAVTIAVPELRISNGAVINARTENARRGGNITLDLNRLTLTGGGQVITSTLAAGRAGNILVQADRVQISGSDPTFAQRLEELGSDRVLNESNGESGLFTNTRTGSSGDGGNVEISTTTLAVRDGAVLSAITAGDGNAGNVVIEAGRITFSGTSEDGQLSSGVFSSVEASGIGDGGNIEIRTTTLEVLDGAQLSAGVLGQGNAGAVLIRAGDRVIFSGTSEDGQFSSGAFSAVRAGSVGEGGNIEIHAAILEVLGGAELVAGTLGEGNAGNVVIRADDRVTFSNGAVITDVNPGSVIDGSNIIIHTAILEVFDGARLSASTSGGGNAGSVIIQASDRIDLDGVAANGSSSGIFTVTTRGATGRGGAVMITAPELQISNGAVINARTENARRGGNITLDLDRLTLTGGGQVISSTLGAGRAGNISVQADRVQISGSAPTVVIGNEGNGESGLFTNTRPNSSGDGGNITLRLNDLEMNDGAILSAQSQGTGTAGRLTVRAQGNVILTDSDLTTSAEQSSGGAIFVSARDIRLFGDSDITTFVQRGEGGGGDITLRGDTIVALSDSDILAFSVDGSGGNITLDTRAFFGENYRPATGILTREQIEALDGNNRVDINATGQVQSGDIVTPDTSFIQNSLSNLSETIIDTEELLANSCIARATQNNTFLITGGSGLPERPGDLPITTYSTGDVRSIPDGQESSDERLWQPGDPIMEPQGVYQLPDGRLVLSRECD